MKKIITVILFLVCCLSFGQYSYKGKTISEDKFNELYFFYSKFLFLYKDKVFDLMDNNGDIKKIGRYIYADKNTGMLSGTINLTYKENNKAHVIMSITERIEHQGPADDVRRIGGSLGGSSNLVKDITYKTNQFEFLVINLLPEDYKEKIDIPVLILDRVKKGHGNEINSDYKLATRLLPITREQFAKYLADGNPLYKIEKTPAVKGHCPDCNGSGKVKNPNYNRKKMDSKQVISCDSCKGTGKIISIPEKNIKVERIFE